MAVDFEQVAQTFNLTPDELQRESLRAYITQQERLTEMDMADLRDRYRVTSPAELKSRIEGGAVRSHPAWEDMMELEHLTGYLHQLAELKSSLN
jgi:hypothetical protein